MKNGIFLYGHVPNRALVFAGTQTPLTNICEKIDIQIVAPILTIITKDKSSRMSISWVIIKKLQCFNTSFAAKMQ